MFLSVPLARGPFGTQGDKPRRCACPDVYRLVARAYRPALLLLVLLLSLSLPTRAAEPPAATPVGPGAVFLALGDSLATGSEAAANNDHLPGYPADLLARLRTVQPAIRLENLARSEGETSSSFIADGQLAAAESFIRSERAAGRVVSPVTLSIGGNDMAAVIRPGSTATVTATLTLYASNLDNILDRLLAALTDEQGRRTGDLIIANYYNPYPGLAAASPFSLEADPDRDIPRFNQLISNAAAARDIPLADLYTAFPQAQPALGELIFVRFPYDFSLTQLEQNFDFHPRAAGHRLIAASFAEASGYSLAERYLVVALPLVQR